jgi:hypothetical protein
MPRPSRVPAAKYTPEHRAEARRLYMEHGNYEFVGNSMKIAPELIRRWGMRGDNGVSWATQREEAARSVLEDGFTRRKLSVAAAANLAPDIVKRGLEALAARNQPLSASEMERVMNVHTALDRIARLDAGKSTENHAVQANVKLSIEDIQKIFREDPLLGE